MKKFFSQIVAAFITEAESELANDQLANRCIIFSALSALVFILQIVGSFVYVSLLKSYAHIAGLNAATNCLNTFIDNINAVLFVIGLLFYFGVFFYLMLNDGFENGFGGLLFHLIAAIIEYGIIYFVSLLLFRYVTGWCISYFNFWL